MKPINKKLTISEAARDLGYSSRSQLYNLIKKGYLNNYLWIDEKGRKYLEMCPVGGVVTKGVLVQLYPSFFMQVVSVLFICL